MVNLLKRILVAVIVYAIAVTAILSFFAILSLITGLVVERLGIIM
jgi:hypothetical protein